MARKSGKSKAAEVLAGWQQAEREKRASKDGFSKDSKRPGSGVELSAAVKGPESKSEETENAKSLMELRVRGFR